MRILGDVAGGIAAVIDQNFLSHDIDAHSSLKPVDFECPVFALELHQVERCKVASSVVEENVFRARVGRMNRLGAFAGVPALDRAVILQAGIAANPGAFGDLVQQCRRILLLQETVVGGTSCPPFLAVQSRLHEFVTHANRQVFVLVHDAAVSGAIVRAVVALFDQGPCLFLLFLLGVDEFLDVAMPIAQRVHFGGAPSLATRLHDVGHLVINLEERKRSAWASAAAEFFATGADGGQVGASARSVFEKHRLAVSQLHDALHVIVHGLNEAGAALGILVLSAGAFDRTGLRVIIPIPAR